MTFSANISVSFSYILGFIVSSILISRLLGFLFDKYKASSYFCVMGFMLGSLYTMFVDLKSSNAGFLEVLIGIFLLFIGAFSTEKINSFFGKF